MKRIHIKNFIIDSRSQQPILVLQTTVSRRTLPVTLNIFDVPRILSALYKIKEDHSDLHHAIPRLFKQLKFLKMKRIVLFRKKELYCELHYSVLGLITRKIDLNLTDGLILYLLNKLPFYADASAFRKNAPVPAEDKTLHQVYPRNILEKWNPPKTDSSVH
jgi:hypothetical protein